MSVQMLEMKPVLSVDAVLKAVRSPLKVPAWFVVLVVMMVGVFGYVAGRKNPAHHYVPYVGYPLVLDTTSGKACYSTTPKASENATAIDASYSSDGSAVRNDSDTPIGPAIPMCGK